MRFYWWLVLPLFLLGTPVIADAQPGPALSGEPLPAGASARFGSLKWRVPAALSAGQSRLAISPDGKRVAACAGGLAVWDVAGDHELYYLSDSSAVYSDVAISADSKLLAVAAFGKTHTVKIMDLASGKEQMQIETQENGQEPLAFSPDGKKLVAGGRNSPMTVWDLSTGKKQWEYRSKAKWQIPFASSPDGRWLALAEADQKIAILHFETGRKHRTLYIPQGYVQIAFSPDARSLVVSDAITLAIFEIATGKLRFKIPINPDGRFFQLAPNGKKLGLFGDRSKAIHWYDPFTGQLLDSWTGHQSSVYRLALSQDGRTTVSGSSDGNVHVWDAATGKVNRAPSGLASACDFLAFSADDKTILAIGYDIHFLSAKTLEEDACVQFDVARPRVVALSPNGKTVACAQQSGWSIVIIDVTDRKEVRKIWNPDGGAEMLAFGPDSKTLYGFGFTVPDSGKGPLKLTSRVWNVATGVENKPLQVDFGLSLFDLAISAQGKLVAAGYETIPTLDLKSGKQEGSLQCRASKLLFSHEGTILVTKLDDLGNSTNSTIKLHDFKKRTEILAFKEFKTRVRSWCFSHDDKILALGHANGSFTLWSIPAGKNLAELPAHRGPVTALAFSHDGETLVTGSSDGTILKWPAKAWRGK